MSGTQSNVPGVVWDTSRDRWRVYTGTGKARKFVASSKSKEEAENISRNASLGLLPSDAGKHEAMMNKMARIRMRAVWREVVDSQPHEWLSFDHFLASVGDRPEHERKLEAKNPEFLIGPNNFQWVKPEFDHKTKEGRSSFQKANRLAKPDLYRNQELRRNFGITLKEYEEKLESQGGVCAICNKFETSTRNGTVRCLAVDHNHFTKQVRGLLCTNCNVAVGMMYENRDIMKAAIDYLKKWEKIESTPKSQQPQPIE